MAIQFNDTRLQNLYQQAIQQQQDPFFKVIDSILNKDASPWQVITGGQGQTVTDHVDFSAHQIFITPDGQNDAVDTSKLFAQAFEAAAAGSLQNPGNIAGAPAQDSQTPPNTSDVSSYAPSQDELGVATFAAIQHTEKLYGQGSTQQDPTQAAAQAAGSTQSTDDTNLNNFIAQGGFDQATQSELGADVQVIQQALSSSNPTNPAVSSSPVTGSSTN